METSDSTSQLPATQQASSLPCATSTHTRRSDLLPVGAKQGTAELAACLTLVAPTGMTGEERAQWISVARQSLQGIPADLLEWGCKTARQSCRFPSEIVPTIMQTVKAAWDMRLRLEQQELDRRERMSIPALPKPDRVTPEEMAAILIEHGLKRGGQA